VYTDSNGTVARVGILLPHRDIGAQAKCEGRWEREVKKEEERSQE
jgi:hypothetical protein